jgi:hypothetical protein
MLVSTYDYNGVQPALRPDLAISNPVRLPFGGPYNVGGPYPKGTVCGSVASATPANEVRTYTITGTPTGVKVGITFVSGDRVYTAETSNAASVVMTAADLQTALQTIFGTGNVAVAKSALVYTITFAGMLANTRIGGLLTFTPTFTAGTSPAGSMARTAAGSCGSGQYDVQADGASDGTQIAKAVLRRSYTSTPTGGNVTEVGGATQPESPQAWFTGFFRAADVRNLTTTGLATFGKIFTGANLGDPDAIVSIR